MNKFCISWYDEDGLYIEALHWTTNNRFFCKYRVGGVEKKAKRISEQSYISAWEWYNNY